MIEQMGRRNVIYLIINCIYVWGAVTCYRSHLCNLADVICWMLCFKDEGTITPQCAVTRVRPLLLQYHWDTLSLIDDDDKNDHIACSILMLFCSFFLLLFLCIAAAATRPARHLLAQVDPSQSRRVRRLPATVVPLLLRLVPAAVTSLQPPQERVVVPSVYPPLAHSLSSPQTT